MKVRVGSSTYAVHWETKKFAPEHANKRLEIDVTTCIVRELYPDGDYQNISIGIVRQHPRDSSNNVLARKLSFTKAVGFFDKDARCLFWSEFKKTTRLTKMSLRAKNKKLQETVNDLQGIIYQLRKDKLCVG
jgi:hypothetical protein